MRFKLVDSITSNWIDHFIVVSQSLKGEFVQRGYPPEKLTVVRNGIDTPDTVAREKLKRELGIPANELLVGTAARLTEQKGLDAFLTVASRIADTGRNVHFAIAGDGELRSDLERQAEALGISARIHFLGFRNDILDVIAGFDLMLYLSRWEPFANTILEAMAVGTPVIASDVGGNAEVIEHGNNGLLVPPDDPEITAKLVSSVLGDANQRAVLIDGARHTVKRFTIESMVRSHEAVYERIYSNP